MKQDFKPYTVCLSVQIFICSFMAVLYVQQSSEATVETHSVAVTVESASHSVTGDAPVTVASEESLQTAAAGNAMVTCEI